MHMPWAKTARVGGSFPSYQQAIGGNGARSIDFDKTGMSGSGDYNALNAESKHA